jgi:hypothetical protein
MNKDAMNQGVQILLDRMDTNPEEFDDYTGKWGDIIGAVHARKSIPEGHSKDAPLPFLTDPEVNALYDKLEDVRRENFTADVLRRLADDSVKQQELWDTSYSSSNYPVLGTPPSLTTTLPYTTGTSISLSEREKEQIADAIDEIKHKRHQDLHKAFGLAVKAEAVKADRKKAVK